MQPAARETSAPARLPPRQRERTDPASRELGKTLRATLHLLSRTGANPSRPHWRAPPLSAGTPSSSCGSAPARVPPSCSPARVASEQDKIYCLLSVRNARALTAYFHLLDVHKKNALNNLQFYRFLQHVTNLSSAQIMLVFDLLDWDGKGEIGFDEFYMLVCIIMAHENHLEKQFMYRHSHAVFELLDIDGGHTVAPAEFQATRFLFNIRKTELSQIFKDFDISGDEQLNYKEFRMFTIFCIDRQQRKAKDKLKREMAKAASEAEAEEEYTDYARFKQNKF